MNTKRRKQIEEVVSQLEKLASQIEVLHDEEQACFDNLSEKSQEGEKGEELYRNISSIADAHRSIEDAVVSLREVQ